MGLVVIAEPASEPVTLAEAKLQIRQDPLFTIDDTYISSLIVGARRYVESRTARSLIYTGWRLTLPRFPLAADFADPNFQSYNGAPLQLPRSPVAFITASTLAGIAYDTPRVQYIGQDGSTQTALRGTVWEDDFSSLPPCLQLLPAQYWPIPQVSRAMPVTVDFIAGYGPDRTTVPQEFKQAILLLVDHWYRQRSPVGEPTAQIDFTLRSLLGVCHDGHYP